MARSTSLAPSLHMARSVLVVLSAQMAHSTKVVLSDSLARSPALVLSWGMAYPQFGVRISCPCPRTDRTYGFGAASP